MASGPRRRYKISNGNEPVIDCTVLRRPPGAITSPEGVAVVYDENFHAALMRLLTMAATTAEIARAT
jgi:hypothetical protein